ncbi:hypothetical protein LVO79_15540 [Roseivivax marinus]|uniref:hypothetical protein n=1 Tax=Roseivivax marinus TaxID=1379903 RepID=UPI001F043F84|nr:hypothetical protein [Roseivivax marinus]UMA64406.1 hypothetical protein LVO79_15540 [Roseivivax marinus]
MIEALIATAVLLTLPLGVAIWVKIAEARLDREDRLRTIEAELNAIKASLPASSASEVDHLVAAFAMGAAFAARSVARSTAGTDESSAGPTSRRKSGTDGGEIATTTAAISATM